MKIMTELKLFITVAFFKLLSLEYVSANNYCEFGLCEKEQYCCGDNKCCSKALDLWFFWSGIFLIIFGLALAAGIRYTRSRHKTYVLLTAPLMEDVLVSEPTFK